MTPDNKSSDKIDPAQGGFPSGMSQPALRAFEAAGILRLEQLPDYSEAELLALHGVGPKTIRQLRPALAEKGLAFKR